jgi:DNA-binding transcriptional ArsR family regulator
MSARSRTAKGAGRRDAGLPAILRSNEALASVFAALGDPTRLKLVAVLCAGGAFSIAQLTANTEISRQGVTKHLQVLADAGVVRGVKLGRERLWQLEPGQIEEAKRTLEVIGRQWEVALGKLKAFAESP